MILRLASVVALCTALAACDPVTFTAVGVALELGLHSYELAGKITAGTSQGIEIACRALIAKEAALTAQGQGAAVAKSEEWSGAAAFCDPANPPPADPIAGAFWLGTVIARMD